MRLQTWLTEYWDDYDLLPDGCLKLYISQCPIFLEKSSVKGQTEGKVEKEQRGERTQEFSCIGTVEGNKK